jgi:hypothetical protein|tara:strand:+ start:9935 stop:10201 length:267 start_codon:yes stop_codon:yes gene_type:complete
MPGFWHRIFISLQQQLLDLGELFNFADLSTFTQNIPIEWVASALDLSAQASNRRRRLPSDPKLVCYVKPRQLRFLSKLDSTLCTLFRG